MVELSPPMQWNAWGDPDAAKPLSDQIQTLLKTALGAGDSPATAPEIDEVRLRESTLSAEDSKALAAIVGADYLLDDHRARLLRAGGKSTPDLFRRKDPGIQDAPDAVLLPGDENEIAQILEYCSQHGIAVVAFGGGTSVVGGLDPTRGQFDSAVSLDLRRLDELFDLDEISGQAELGAGLTGPEAERLLGERGFSLGHFPQSFQFASIGGFAATRSSGQNSSGYGRFDDMIRGLRVVTPAGVLNLGRAPASAAGPDLRQLIIGSEGTFGIITRVQLRVHPVPETTRYEAWSFPDFATGTAALRAVTQTGAGPTVIRLSDEAETGINLATTESIGEQSITGGCLAITVFEGTAAHAESRHAETREIMASHGGTSLGEDPAKAWEHGRFSAPYLRDSLLAAGALCDTLETATNWSNVPALKSAVTEAVTTSLAESGTPALVLCHISHVYPTGACLYFTVVAGQRGNPIEQWLTAKAAASEALVRCGATITHHHAVGTDHKPWMTAEVGDLGVELLRAVQSDPRSGRDPEPRQTDSVTRFGRRAINAVTVLTNPASGHGNALRVAERAMARFRQRGVDAVEIVGTDSDHARRLLDAALTSGTDALVVTGGDGVISLALQSLAGGDVPLGIIPAGTGNDHAREFSLPRDDPEAAVDIVCDGRTEAVDLGHIRGDDGTQKWFGTIMAAGFDSLVSDRANRMRWPHGRMRYNLAMVAELSRLRPLPFRLVLDGGEEIVTELTMAEFGNTRSYGGGMQICPAADRSDGQLDITLVAATPRIKLVRLFATVFKGAHTGLKEVTVVRAAKARVSSPGINAYADGEYVCPLPVEVSVVSGALQVLRPG